MQRNESSFTVIRAKLSVNERIMNVTYREASGDRPLTTELQASGFEHYLKCLHDVECPSLVEWMLRAAEEELHTRLAAFMECMMWEAYEEAAIRSINCEQVDYERDGSDHGRNPPNRKPALKRRPSFTNSHRV